MRKTAFFLLAFWLVAAGSARAETVVIVNRANALSSLSRTELEMIYFGKMKVFGNGETAMPADLPRESAVRQDFFENILGKAEESYRLYWVRMIFSGKGHPPVAVKSEDDAVKHVTNNRGGIAFIDSGRLSPDVKAVTITGKE